VPSPLPSPRSWCARSNTPFTKFIFYEDDDDRNAEHNELRSLEKRKNRVLRHRRESPRPFEGSHEFSPRGGLARIGGGNGDCLTVERECADSGRYVGLSPGRHDVLSSAGNSGHTRSHALAQLHTHTFALPDRSQMTTRIWSNRLVRCRPPMTLTCRPPPSRFTSQPRRCQPQEQACRRATGGEGILEIRGLCGQKCQEKSGKGPAGGRLFSSRADAPLRIIESR